MEFAYFAKIGVFSRDKQAVFGVSEQVYLILHGLRAKFPIYFKFYKSCATAKHTETSFGSFVNPTVQHFIPFRRNFDRCLVYNTTAIMDVQGVHRGCASRSTVQSKRFFNWTGDARFGERPGPTPRSAWRARLASFCCERVPKTTDLLEQPNKG